MKAIFTRMNLMEKENIIFLMVIYTKAILKMGLEMDMEFIILIMEIKLLIKEIGMKIIRMEMELLFMAKIN